MTDVTERLNGSPYDALKMRAKNKAKIKTASLEHQQKLDLRLRACGHRFRLAMPGGDDGRIS